MRFIQTFVEAFDLKSAKDSAVFAIGLKDSSLQVHDFNWVVSQQQSFPLPSFKNVSKILSIKDICSQKEFCPLWTFCRQGGWMGFFNADVQIFLLQKTYNFSKIMVCPQGENRLRQCRRFSDKLGRGVNFWRFCADAFCGRPTRYFQNCSMIFQRSEF